MGRLRLVSILIVGGAGYIGSQTAKGVAQAGLQPVVFDNLVYGHEWAVKWGPLVEGDLADGALLVERVLERARGRPRSSTSPPTPTSASR